MNIGPLQKNDATIQSDNFVGLEITENGVEICISNSVFFSETLKPKKE